MVELTEEAVERVPERGGMAVSGGSSAVVVGTGWG